MLFFAGCCCEEAAEGDIVGVQVEVAGAAPAISDRGNFAFEEKDSLQVGIHTAPATATGESEVARLQPKASQPTSPGPQDFVVSLARAPDERLGLKLEVFDKRAAFITEVEADGAVAKYNASATEQHRIRPGDYIVASNGVLGKSDAGKEDIPESLLSSASGRSEIIVRRAKTLSVQFEKNGLPLGLMLKYGKLGNSILITFIDDAGAVKSSRVDVRPGDRILAVNGKCGSVEEQLTELRRNAKLELRLSRM
mmetsp:Transcript_82035/g.230143  ORF Transcript_82035/g.230143 Transcript_82035/m.230143 type:complete len:252 (+) Transcript_82035:65-820(+)